MVIKSILPLVVGLAIGLIAGIALTTHSRSSFSFSSVEVVSKDNDFLGSRPTADDLPSADNYVTSRPVVEDSGQGSAF